MAQYTSPWINWADEDYHEIASLATGKFLSVEIGDKNWMGQPTVQSYGEPGFEQKFKAIPENGYPSDNLPGCCQPLQIQDGQGRCLSNTSGYFQPLACYMGDPNHPNSNQTFSFNCKECPLDGNTWKFGENRPANGVIPNLIYSNNYPTINPCGNPSGPPPRAPCNFPKYKLSTVPFTDKVVSSPLTGYSNLPDDVWIDTKIINQCCNGSPLVTPSQCGPHFSSQLGGACIEYILNKCSAKNGKELPWSSEFCKSAINNPAAAPNAKLIVNEYVNSYIQNNKYDTNNPVFKTVIPYLCSRPNVAGTCDATLLNFCSNKTRDDLVSDLTLQVLCGCHLPYSTEVETAKNYPYADETGGPSCDPICQYTGTIQNSAFPVCQSTNCVMDNITVNIVDSSSGSIKFSQICGTCDSGGKGTKTCQCWFSNITVNEIGSMIGKLDFESNCGACFVTPPGGDGRQRQLVDCKTLAPYSCKIASDCPQGAGLQCINGTCANQICSDDSDCSDGLKCIDKLCGGVAKPGSGDGSWLKNHPYLSLGMGIGFLVFVLFIVLMVVYFKD